MKRSNACSFRKLLLSLAVALAAAPAAYASDDTHAIVLPAKVARGGSIFVVESVIHNVDTGERAVISQECEAVNGPAPPALYCIQLNPEPTGMQIFVKTGPYKAQE